MSKVRKVLINTIETTPIGGFQAALYLIQDVGVCDHNFFM